MEAAVRSAMGGAMNNAIRIRSRIDDGNHRVSLVGLQDLDKQCSWNGAAPGSSFRRWKPTADMAF